MIRSSCQGFGRTFHSTTPNLDAKNNRLEPLIKAAPMPKTRPCAVRAPEYHLFSLEIDSMRNRATDQNDRNWRRGLVTTEEYLKIERALIDASNAVKRAWRLNWYREQRALAGAGANQTKAAGQ